MKVIILSLFTLLYSATNSCGQNDSIDNKNLFVLYLGNSTYQLTSASNGSKLNYESLNPSSGSFDAIAAYKRQISGLFSVQTGIEYAERYSANNIVDTFNLKILEKFFNVPLILCISFKKLQGMHGLKANISFGATFSVLANQKLLAPTSNTLPNGFNESAGFGKYMKWGTLIELISEIPFQNEKSGIAIGLRYFTEVKNNEIFESENLTFTPAYRGLTTMVGIYKRF